MSGYILEKVEDAWVNYIGSSSLSGSIHNFYRGMGSADKSGSAVIVYCPTAAEIMYGTGIYNVTTIIQLIYVYENTGSLTTRNTVVSDYKDKVLANDNLLANLTGSTTNLHIHDVTLTNVENSLEGDCYISAMQLSVIAAQI